MLYRMKDAKPIKLGFNPFAKGFTDGELKDAFYRLTCDPKQQLLILESCSLEEADGEYGGDEPTCDGCTADCASCGMKRDDGMVLEAVRVRAFSRTTQTMAALQRSLNKYMADKGLTVGEAAVGKPKKSGLFATVTVQFPVSDGQTITIIFHSPDGNKLTITAADEILAFRWLLNKRDITVAVAPEGEADVSLEEVGKRVAMLVEKNSKAFQSKSKEIADQKGQLADLTTQVATAQGEVATLQANYAELEQASSEIDGQIEQTTAQLSKVQEFNAGLQQKISELQAVQAGNSGKAKGETKGYESGAAAYEATLTALGFAADENNPDSKSFILRYVDENWGKAGAGSQTTEKITTAYGVEPDGAVAVIVGGAGANKKFTAKSVATAKNAFDKATDLVTELAGQVTSMEAWLTKYGPSVANVKVGDKFKVLINRRRPADGYYGTPGIVTSIGDATDGNNPGLPAVRLSIGETTVSAFAYNAWAAAVSSRDVAPWGEDAGPMKELEIEELPSLGVATITDVGSENIYITKDGVSYFCKVGNTDKYEVGQFDFAAKPAAASWTPSVGDTVYFQDAYDTNKRYPANFRGFNGDQAVLVWNGSQMSIEKSRIFKDDLPGGGNTDTNPDRADENAAVTILNDILAGKYADSGSISDALDQAAEQLEGAGLMEMYDDRLNAAADYLTEVLKKEAA